MRQARPTVTLHITPESPGREAARHDPPAPRPTPPPARGDDRLLLTVVDAARRLEVSRSLMYELLAAGEIDSVHVGRLRRVPVDALTSYVARLRANGIGAASDTVTPSPLGRRPVGSGSASTRGPHEGLVSASVAA